MRRDFDLAELVGHLREAGIQIDVRQYLAANELLLAIAARGTDLTADPGALASHLAPIFSGSPEAQALVRDRLLAWGKPPPPDDPPGPGAPENRRRRGAHLRPHVPSIAGACVLGMLAAGVLGDWYFGAHRVAAEIVAGPIGGKAPALQAATVTYGGAPERVDRSGAFFVITRRAQADCILRVSLEGYATQAVAVNFLTPAPIRIHLTAAFPTPAPVDEAGPALFDKPVVLGQASVANSAIPVTQVPWLMLAAMAAAVVVFMLLGLEFFHRTRRHWVLRRMSRLGDDPKLMTLHPPMPRFHDIPPLPLRRISAGLRRARTQDTTSVSIEATVEATARAGGFFNAVSVARVATPEYLILVDQRGPDDQSALMVGHWMDQLEQFGVAMNRYYFSGDPRRCWKGEAPERRLRLTDLLQRHHQAALLLFADAEVCLDPLSGTTWPWVKTLRSLSRCALLTFAPPYRWSGADRSMIQAGFIVLPASVAGLQLAVTLGEEWHQPTVPLKYARAYPGLMSGNDTRWLDRNAPPAETVALLLRQLHGYLGPGGYAWLSACAIYPQMSWPITLALLDVVTDAEDELGRRRAVEEQLPSLSRLPWFRYGYMPDWLRRVCIASLTQEVAANARARLGDLIYRLLDTGAAAATATGSRAADTSVPSATDLRLWSTPHDIAASAPAGSPLNDAVFLGFLGGADPDPLTLHLRGLPPTVRIQPRSLFRYAYSRWRLLAIQWPRTMRSLIAVLTGAIAFAVPALWLPRVPQVAPTPPFSVTYYLPLTYSMRAVPAQGAPFQVSSNGNRLASAMDASRIFVTDAETAAGGYYVDSKQQAEYLTLSGDGTLLATLSDLGVTLTNLGDRSNRTLPVTAGSVAAIEFSPDGRQLVVATDQDVQRSDVTDLIQQTRFSTSESVKFAVALSPGGTFIAAGDAGRIRVWDTRSGFVTRQLTLDDSTTVNLLAVSADGNQLAVDSTSANKVSLGHSRIALWDLRNSAAPARIIDAPGTDGNLVFSPDGAFLAARDSNAISFYDVHHDGTKVAAVSLATGSTLATPYVAVRFSATADDPNHTLMQVLEWRVRDTPPSLSLGKTPSAPPNDGDRYWIYLGNYDGKVWAKKYVDFPVTFDPTRYHPDTDPAHGNYAVKDTALNVRYGAFGPTGGFPPVTASIGVGRTVTLRSTAQWFNSNDWWATIAPQRSFGARAKTPDAAATVEPAMPQRKSPTQSNPTPAANRIIPVQTNVAPASAAAPGSNQPAALPAKTQRDVPRY